jgi:hypothetical protein
MGLRHELRLHLSQEKPFKVKPLKERVLSNLDKASPASNSLCLVLMKHLLKQVSSIVSEVGRDGERLGEDPVEKIALVLRVEGRQTSEELKEKSSDRVDVAHKPMSCLLDHLRTEVLWTAAELSGSGVHGESCSREAEICEG